LYILLMLLVIVETWSGRNTFTDFFVLCCWASSRSLSCARTVTVSRGLKGRTGWVHSGSVLVAEFSIVVVPGNC